jgi:hypothetical protein
MSTSQDPRLNRLDDRDRAYVETLEPHERDVVVATVARHRRPERLRVGDELPELAALRLGDAARVTLRGLVDGRPLLLVFGSFT